MPSKPRKNKCRHCCRNCNELLEDEKSRKKAPVKKKATKDIKKEKLDKTEYNVIIKNFLEVGCDTNGEIIPTSKSILNNGKNVTNKKATSKKTKGVSKPKVTAKEAQSQKLKTCPKSPKKKCQKSTEKTSKATNKTKNNVNLDLINEVAHLQLWNQAYAKQNPVFPYPVASIKIEEVNKQPKKAPPKPKNNKTTKKSDSKINVVKKNQNKENVPKTKPELTTELSKKRGRPRVTKNSNKTSAEATLIDSAHVIEANLLNQLPDLNPDNNSLTKSPNSPTIIAVDTFSWTGEISSSSPSLVTVPSNDIVTIDGKLPVVCLVSIEHLYHKLSFGDSASLINDANETDNESVYIKTHSLHFDLNLSMSTLKSSTSSSSSSTTRHEVDIGNNSKNDLQTKLQKDLFDFQSEPMENILNNATKQLLVILKTEAIIMEDCCSVRAQISNLREDYVPHVDAIVESVDIVPAESTAIAETEDLVDSHVPVSTILETLEPESPKDDKNHNGNPLYHHSPMRMEEQENSKEDNSINNKETIQTSLPSFAITENNIAEPSVSRYNEPDKDDDCLSLYAESNMSLESTCFDTIKTTKKFTINNESNKNDTPLQEKKNITFTQPLFKYLLPENTQLLSKPDRSQNIKIICQNNNVSSLNPKNRVIVSEPSFNGNYPKMNDQINNETDNLKPVQPNEVSYPYKSVLLMNTICFYNLSGYCRFGSCCKFKHIFPTDSEISMRLEKLTNETFNNEYLKLRRHDKPMYMYLKCFVDNCLYRGMPRLLVQMAIDTQNLNHDNTVWKTTILENILISLRQDDVDACKDLFIFNFENDYLLCDLFMKVICNSQNICPFQLILGVLATFFIDIKRNVHIDVALKILERVSILPKNEELLLSVLKIVYNTDSSILSMELMVPLRNAVLELNSDMLNEYMNLHVTKTDKVIIKLSSGLELNGVDNAGCKSPNLNKLRNMPMSSEMLSNKLHSNNFRQYNNMNGPPALMGMNFKAARNTFNKWKAVPNKRFMMPNQQNNNPPRRNPYEILIDRRF